MTDPATAAEHDRAMTEWLSRFATALGVDAPTMEDIDRCLRLAALAAHASVRQAAPVACWLASRAAVPLEDALAIAAGMETTAGGG